jgi:hypothetical protein
MKRISKTAALLCGVYFCRIGINKGFNVNALHNGELHIKDVPRSLIKYQKLHNTYSIWWEISLLLVETCYSKNP